MCASYNASGTTNVFSVFASGTTNTYEALTLNGAEKPRWLIGSRSGTIYEDSRVQQQKLRATKQKLKPRIIRGLEACYRDIESDEVRKHESRQRILRRFRQRRLQNSCTQLSMNTLQSKPLIFTPDAATALSNPFHPNLDAVEHHTTNNLRIERLAEPKLRCDANTPEFADFDEPEIGRVIRDIKQLKNIRHQYHWRSFAHRGDCDDDETASCATAETAETVSTCSNASCFEGQRGHVMLRGREKVRVRQSSEETHRQGKECMDELSAFDGKLAYLTRKKKNRNRKHR